MSVDLAERAARNLLAAFDKVDKATAKKYRRHGDHAICQPWQCGCRLEGAKRGRADFHVRQEECHA